MVDELIDENGHFVSIDIIWQFADVSYFPNHISQCFEINLISL